MFPLKISLAGAFLIWVAVLATQSGGAARAQDPPQGMMKAIRVHEHGGPEVLKYEDVAIPKPGSGEMLVRVHAAGVNPVDAAIRRGGFGRGQLPYTPGHDIAGVVGAIGEGVTSFETGQRVFAYLPVSRPGGYAQYAIVKETEAAVLPEKVSYIDGAGVPLVALTAWQALFDRGDLQKGQTVLIHAGAGGVGTMAIQLAKWRGAKVITTASEANHQFLRDLGADEVIDYTKEKFEEKVKDVDVVLDSIGGDTRERSWVVLKPGGVLVSIVGPPDAEAARQHGVRATSFLVQPHALELSRIARLLEEGKIRTVTGQTFPLEEAAKAHEQIETRHTRGKIVLIVKKPPDDTPEADGVPKLIGTAIGADGMPGARLPVILKERHEDAWRVVAKGLTNDDGDFSIRGMPIGSFSLEIGDRWRTPWVQVGVLGRAKVVDVGTLVLEPRRPPRPD